MYSQKQAGIIRLIKAQIVVLEKKLVNFMELDLSDSSVRLSARKINNKIADKNCVLSNYLNDIRI